MRVRPALLFGLVMLLSAPGCLQSKETVAIKADGSGAMEGSYTVDLKKLKELIDTARMLYPQEAEGQEIADELPNPFDRAWFEQAAKTQKGFRITGGSTVEKDGVRTSTIKATFTSLEAAARGGAFFSTSVTLEPHVPKAKDGEAAPPRPPVTTGREDGDGGEGDAGAERPKAWKLSLKEAWLQTMGGVEPRQVLPGFEPQLAGAKIVRRFTLPAKVISTNGVLAEDGKTVTFTVSYEGIVRGDEPSMHVVFENPAGLALERFAYAPDVMKLMPRFTGKPPAAEQPPAPDEGGGK